QLRPANGWAEPECALSGCGDQGASSAPGTSGPARRWTARPPPLLCPVGWAWARALARHDEHRGQPGPRLRLSAQIPAGGRQRRGQRRDPGEPAGRCGRVPVWPPRGHRLQDHHHPAGRPAGEAAALGVILVYDIANRWSFDGIDRWIKEINEHAPGVPKILVGNRLHLAFKRQVPTEQAQAYAERLGVTFFEVSPLCNFNITESFMELARIVLLRHGMDRLWRPSKVLSLQDLCCRAVVSCTPAHLLDKLPLPTALRSHLKSFSMATGLSARMVHGRPCSLATSSGHKRTSLRKAKGTHLPQSPPRRCSRNNCKVS
uniref:RAB40B, member RAS oncogene family n=1 Tax=Ovis aries TaxID=9940 RepID=A0AC11CQW7_SHEEP